MSKRSDRENFEMYANDALRKLDRLDVKHPTNEPTETHPYPLRFDLTGELQYEAWFLDSIYTGLTVRDAKVALRCAFQAFGYIHKFRPSSYDHDLLLVLRNRCESFLD